MVPALTLQGMHELLAVCLLVVDRDTLSPATTPDHLPSSSSSSTSASGSIAVYDALRTTLDRRYVEHDAFALFQEIMRGAKAFYEWRGDEVPASGGAGAGARRGAPQAPAPTQTQAPIITRCQNLHNSLLRRVDPQVWERCEGEGLEPQIWAM
jgi:TBC1 domain family protein 5